MLSYKKEGTILKAENICLEYERPILRDVSFEINDIIRPDMTQGQVVSLVGRSGIGKTQLFRVLSGLLKPQKGSVRVGTDLHIIQVGEVAVVPQNYLLFNHRTIFTNLKIGLTGSGVKISDKEIKEIINSYADRFGLTDHLKKYPMELSGGQRQRVSIIQQILTGNEFILLDEPFSGLDSVVKESILKLLVAISNIDELKTLIIISHDIENSLAISDTALILANEEGKQGSTITNTFDLASMGLAWDPKIKENNTFKELVNHIKTII